MTEPATTAGKLPGPSRWRRVWYAAAGVAVLVTLGLALVAAYEMRTFRFEAAYFGKLARQITFAVEPGPSPSPHYPTDGPYDVRHGYTSIDEVIPALLEAGFRIDSQARVSPLFSELMQKGISPIYHAKDQAGMVVLDRRGDTMYSVRYPATVYPDFQSIPPAIWKSLLFIENRGLLNPEPETRNAAVDWPRLIQATLSLVTRQLGRPGSVAGASTLATQLEKFRHSPGGLTASPRAKLAQMFSASLRTYMDGSETLRAREEIVRAYINSMPLAGIPGHGEVTGLADGLHAWFGADFGQVNELLRELEVAESQLGTAHGEAYIQVLELLLSVQRPSYYLVDSTGRRELRERANLFLGLMLRDGILPQRLGDVALNADVSLLQHAPRRPALSFIEMKGANAVRTSVLSLAHLPALYSLDRFDLTVESTLDATAQAEATNLLRRLRDSAFVREQGLVSFRLLERGDPAQVQYAFALFERTPAGNVTRIQTDNVDAPFSLIDGAKLELGSSAKLRTLVSYLEAVERAYHELTDSTLLAAAADARRPEDRLTQWVRQLHAANPAANLESYLQAAMLRRYSASPTERFVTGGGVHTFQNFEPTYDRQSLTVSDAFRNSVNLPFIRIMRDVVEFRTERLPGHPAGMLTARDDPRRQEYLARFADREGRQFLEQFLRRHAWSSAEEAIAALVEGRVLTPPRLAWAIRSVVPGADETSFGSLLLANLGEVVVSPERVKELYQRSDPSSMSLEDRGYLSGIHPLELWLVQYRLEHPTATRAELLDASADVRQEVYGWLFSTRRTAAQDQRIRSILESEAFVEIHRSWRRVGYPFSSLVPSLATSIGSSADSPAALAELVGILLTDGVRQPPVRIRRIELAMDTPYETQLQREPLASERVLSSEVATTVRGAMLTVVSDGTARRASGAIRGADGQPLPMGAKTGTGNNRHRVVGRGGQVVEDRALNRTSTLVFFIGDRFYGSLTAYVAGTQADNYGFTSSLTSQVLKMLAPTIETLVRGGTD